MWKSENMFFNWNYKTCLTDFILKKHEQDKSIVAITAATPGGVSFTKDFRQKSWTR